VIQRWTPPTPTDSVPKTIASLLGTTDVAHSAAGAREVEVREEDGPGGALGSTFAAAAAVVAAAAAAAARSAGSVRQTACWLRSVACKVECSRLKRV